MGNYILAFDPSGNFYEGKGKTGWCLFDAEQDKIVKFGIIPATAYDSQFYYWEAHINLIDNLSGYHPDIVIEDYLLYNNKATSQINSRLETPQLIGVLKHECNKRGLHIAIQTAQAVKTRWTNEILMYKGYIFKNNNSYEVNHCYVSEHTIDSIRHAVHYKTYGKRDKEYERSYGNRQVRNSSTRRAKFK